MGRDCARGREEVSGGAGWGQGESVGARGVCDRSARVRLWSGQGAGEGVRGCVWQGVVGTVGDGNTPVHACVHEGACVCAGGSTRHSHTLVSGCESGCESVRARWRRGLSTYIMGCTRDGHACARPRVCSGCLGPTYTHTRVRQRHHQPTGSVTSRACPQTPPRWRSRCGAAVLHLL